MKLMVEWFIVGVFLIAAVVPYVRHYRWTGTVKGSACETGTGYLHTFARLVKHRALEFFSVLILIILLAAWSIVISLAAVFFLVTVAVAVFFAERRSTRLRK